MTTAREPLLLAALVCSGFASLGYEIVWTRLCAPILGSETLGVLATLAGFFGGMALGAALWHRRAASGPDPLGLFVRLELAAAAFAVVSPYLLHALGGAMPGWLGPDAGASDTPASVALAVAIAALVMLPGTVCIGGTLAAIAEARRRVWVDDDEGRGIARLYGANTFGALLGVLGTVHLVIPTAGLGYGAAVLAAAGACAAILAQRWARGVTIPASPRPASAIVIDTSGDPDPDVREPLPLLVLLGGAGLVGVGLEVAGVLVLSQVLENTIYTFANVLAVYLAGTAAGAWIWGIKGTQWSRGRPATTIAALLVALGLATVLAAIAIVAAPQILDGIAPKGGSYGSHLVAELVVAASVFVVPTMLMGALFSHAMGLVAPGGIGRALAVNTAGGAVAPFIFGVWAPAALGYRDGFYLVAYGYLLVFGAFTWFRRFKPTHQIALILAVVAATALGPRDLVLGSASEGEGEGEADEGWTVLASHQSAMGLVMVKERSDTAGARVPLRRLQIGRHFRMGGAMSFGERRMGHLPLLLAPGATRALYLGVGTGATLGAVRAFDGLQHIDAVEIVPEVLGELGHFDAINARVREDDRVAFHAADARRFVAASAERYDVVVADLFHPGQDGAGGLYSREHFERVAEHLTEGGLFAQWLPIYQLDAETLSVIACTFADVFPGGHAFLGIYNVQTPAVALVGRQGGAALAIDHGALEGQLAAPIYAELLMQDPRDLYASHLLDGAGIDALCGDAPLNTDLWPHVTLRAPKVAYEGKGTHGADNLTRLLELRTPLAASALQVDDTEVLADAAVFGSALAHYLEGELLREQGGDPNAFPPTAIAKYLDAFATAPGFTPPRGMLLAAARSDAAVAEQVLPRMLELAPSDARVWAVWLAHLQRAGDEARLEAARAEYERLRG